MGWTARNAPSTFELFVLSGIFSFIYNIIQFTIVHTLSPSATAFGGNFNKAALVFLTLLLPFLQVHALPPFPYNLVIWLAVLGNVAAFSFYSYLQILAKQKQKESEQKEAMLDKREMVPVQYQGSDDDEDDDDDDEEVAGSVCSSTGVNAVCMKWRLSAMADGNVHVFNHGQRPMLLVLHIGAGQEG